MDFPGIITHKIPLADHVLDEASADAVVPRVALAI